MRKLATLAMLLAISLAVSCAAGAGTTTPPSSDPSAVQINNDVALAAVQRLNNYRAMGGLMPVQLDSRLCMGAQLHANYLALNSVSLGQVGLDAHSEEVGMPGYTEQGERAGRNSVIYEGVTATQAVENWMQTFYHRLGMMDPNLTHVGFGSQGRYQVMDVGQGRVLGFNALDHMSAFPWKGMQNVPGSYIREIPHPILGDDDIGIPITLEFFGTRGLTISNVRASVYDMADNRELAVYVQYPGKPFLPTWDFGQLICIIPENPLPRGSYLVVVDATVDGLPFSHQWDFSTK